jgi:hypothetical protein
MGGSFANVSACIVDKDKILDILAEVKTHHVDEEER